MATKEAKLTRTEMQRLLRKAREFERDADDYRTSGLDERADKLEGEAEQIRERVEASKKAHQRERLERIRRDKAAKKRHEASRKQMKAERARRQAARDWLRSWAAVRGGLPLPADRALTAAEEAGHDPEDILAGVKRVKRLKDQTVCLAFSGEYLRGRYRPVG